MKYVRDTHLSWGINNTSIRVRVLSRIGVSLGDPQAPLA